ncbi:Endo-1,4-beta-xylanase A precursor [Acidisarcina polymorpha]|uniref:Beta-xylanase n=1 Tax=Acidisarcina polymorpha TaxID=2211140 RepID=A0A2Z5G2C8_9BACT|nr:endo-1,4-beta-xylanase [Acidisarcina polymorpha]AXC13281.1 Endo-1,4-beta-xylanase A precursor [Acidisarcina polymorpha]
MFRLSRICTASQQPIRIAIVAAFAFVLTLMATVPLRAQTVATYSFEDGTADGWSSFNGATTPIATTAAAYSGSHSLLTTTSSSGAGGPSISLNSVLLPGAKYTITGYVELTSGESAGNVDFTMKRSDPSCSGGTCYDTIGSYQVPVSDSGWVQIGGTYTASTTETGLTLYAQLVGATSAQSLFLDDVVITETAPPPGGTPIAAYTFADGGLDGWTPFGSATLTNTAPPLPDPNGDTHSLLVTNRTAGYMGPSLNLLGVNNVVAGATYQISAYVLLAATDSSNPTATISTKTADCASSGAYGTVATSAALSTTTWTKVQGTFSYSNLPGPPSSLTLYIQSSSATDSFYISDVTIGELSPAPLSPSQQDNSGITTTFADGDLDGWSSRTGSSTLTNTAPPVLDPNGDPLSLLTTGRIANYDGPQISVNDKMYNGSEYNISASVLMQPTDGSSHVINLSLQTTLNGNTTYSSVTGYPGVTVPADGKWHQISVTGYNMSNSFDPGAAYLYFQTVPASGSDLASFYIDDFQLTYVPPPTIQKNIPSIYKTFADFFPIGAEVDTTDLSGPHAQLLMKHFDSMTPGNDLKWSSVEATKGTFTYENGDAEVGEAVCAEMKVRGQNLVWATGEQVPAYATGDGTNSPANQAVVTANIQEHIQNEVQHFGSKVYAWDVVNEPIDPTQPDCLQHGPFYQVLGPSYIDIAFKAAKEYAPAGTKLFINEYSTTDPAKLACLVKVLHELRDRGVPVNAIGHEMHNQINYPTTESMVHAIDTVHAELPDLEQQITELDLSVYNGGDDSSNYGNNVPASILAEQGWLYKKYFDAFRHLKGKISAVTFWGMADDDTWLDSFPVVRTDYPLPFNMQLHAKPAYWGIVDPTRLPGYGLKFTSTTRRIGPDQIALTLTAANGDVGPAYATLLNAFELRQTEGRRCSPVIHAPGTYPIALGDIPTSGSSGAEFTIDFSGCSESSRFVLEVPWSSATYHTGTYVRELRGRKDCE